MLGEMARRPLRALQVEVTSRCSRHCVVCARTALADRWHEGDLSNATWNRLRPDLELATHVHLQGWGEPLLHPGLRSMVRDVHAAGCRVGVTTNGDFLPAARSWIVSEQVDVLAISLAGLGASNRRLRDGVDTGEVLDAVAGVARDRSESGRPRLHVSFLLVQENASELPELVRTASKCGVAAVMVNHLDCMPTVDLLALSAIGGGHVSGPVHDALERATEVSRELGIEISLPAHEKRDMLTCDDDPLRTVSVRWDGRVGPCVHQTVSIEGPVPRWTEFGCAEVEPAWYGWLDEARLSEIVAGEAYRRFTDRLNRRCEANRRFVDRSRTPSGWGVVALRELETAHRRLEEALAETPFPAACKGCPRQHF